MSFFRPSKGKNRYGIIIDVGSGSVLTAIVHSDINEKHPKIVWSHREFAPLKDVDSLKQSSKSVMTALVNSSMQLDGVGRKTLSEYDKTAKLSEILCTISAPWSYTVTKNINYTQKEPFKITENLLDELFETIRREVDGDTGNNEELLRLGLQTVTRSTLSVLSNGYKVKDPVDNMAETLSVSKVSVVTQDYLVEAVDEVQIKLFTDIECKKISFILVLYYVSREILHHTYDLSLVDITFEATEIGVVRDGVLTYCTHMPFGSFSLAREIAKITKVPLHEAFGYLHSEKPYEFIESLTKHRQDEIEVVLESYITHLSNLFHETGDSLAISKRVSLHTDSRTESLFIDLVEKAVKRTIKTKPHITVISKEIIDQYHDISPKTKTKIVHTDAALLSAAQFFHTQASHQEFDYF